MHPSAAPDGRNLQRRLISTVVILPLAAGAIWAGAWWFAVLLAALSAAMCWEWAQLCQAPRRGVRDAMVGIAMVAPACLVLYGFPAVIAVIVAGTLINIALIWRVHVPNKPLLLVGLPYVVIGVVSAGWLRGDGESGLVTVLWLVAAVIATDVGAYFAGRRFGGPKLAPRISPSKTWSGLAGGMACAGLVGLVVGLTGWAASVAWVVIASLVVAVVAQMGDLIESSLKRHFNVKDASQLIPGHGGFLDRFDGYLTVMPTAALISAGTGGSPIIWQ